MDLSPKSPNNEFVESELVNWVLGNQTKLQMELDVERMKKEKGLCWNKSLSARFEEVCSYILFFSLDTNFHPLRSSVSFSFLYPHPLTFLLHVYTGGLVLILVPSAPSISLHVVAVKLKQTVQVTPPH